MLFEKKRYDARLTQKNQNFQQLFWVSLASYRLFSKIFVFFFLELFLGGRASPAAPPPSLPAPQPQVRMISLKKKFEGFLL